MYVCIVITYSKGTDQPGKVANLARGQLAVTSLLVEPLHMERSWHRYIYITQQGTGLILPCLALIGKCCMSPLLVRVLYSTK